MTRGRPRLLALAAVLAVAAGSVACSSSGSPGGDRTAATAAPDAGGAVATTVPATLTARTAAWSLDQPWSAGVAYAEADGQVVLASGLDAGQASLARVVRIDPARGVVETLPPLPHRLHDAAGVTLPGAGPLLVGGGEQEQATDALTVVVGARAGERFARLPEGRSDLAAVSVDGRAFVLGGYDGKSWVAGIVRVDEDGSSSVVGSLPVPVRYGAATIVGDGADQRILLVGGTTPDGPTDVIQSIDPATGAAAVVGHLPAPLTHAMAFTIDGAAFVAGGRDRNGAPTATILGVDPAGATHGAGSLPTAVSDAAVTVVAHEALLLGGRNGSATLSSVVLVTTG